MLAYHPRPQDKIHVKPSRLPSQVERIVREEDKQKQGEDQATASVHFLIESTKLAVSSCPFFLWWWFFLQGNSSLIHTMLPRNEATPRLRHEFNSKIEAKEYVQLFLSDMCFWEQTMDERPSSPPRIQSCGERESNIYATFPQREQIGDPSFHVPVMSEKDLRWKAAIDPITGKTYYYDTFTRETQWDKVSHLSFISLPCFIVSLMIKSVFASQPTEMKNWERHLKREKRKRDRAFFRDMENNILSSLARNQLIPGIPVANKQTPNSVVETPVKDHTSSTSSKYKHSVRTISGLDERVLASLSNKTEDIPTRDTADMARRPHVARNRAHTKGNDQSLEGRPPLHRRRSDVLIDCEQSSDETRCSPDRSAVDTASNRENVKDEARVPPPTCSNEPNGPMSAHLRRNTGGTIFVRSTMINPDVKATIKCVCGVYRAHIVQGSERIQSRTPRSPHSTHVHLDVFRDDHERSRRLRNTIPMPSTEEIATFYYEYFKRSQMEHDTIIMSLIYVERLIKETNGALSPTSANWRSLLFSSMIMASKVWDDLSMWNIDFSNVSVATGIAPFSLQRINELELSVLKLLRFDVRVAASEYAKYYFLIRNVLIRSGLLEDAAAPLSKEEAKIFEHRTSRYQNSWLSNKTPKGERRTRSFDWEWFNANAASRDVHHGPVLKDKVCLEQLISLDSQP